MNINHELLQFYVYKKLIKRQDVDTVLAESEKLNVGVTDYLHAKEITTQTMDLEALAEYYCMSYIEVDMLDIDKEVFDLFSFDYMKKNSFLPISYDKDGSLNVVIGHPMDMNARSAVASAFAGKINYILTAPILIDRYIDSVSAVITTSQALSDINEESDKKVVATLKSSLVDTASSSEEVVNNPAVRLVDSIIKEAIPYGASDIHIEPFEKKVRVRYRIDGDLQERASFDIQAYPPICARLKIMSGINIAERRVPQDGRINLTISGREYDFRVSSLPSVHGEKFVIRILDKSTFRFNREDLGFTPDENLIIDKMLARPHGIILLTGPTGCGKSTTLYSFLKEVNDPKVNIITVEDPVEYTMLGITQTQVNTKANMTFAAALRSILRQDPDIIMIGEIRDEETAEIAVRAAITGHLVFSTLHTNDAPGAITRLEDMGVPDYLVADALAGVIAQRLVKRLCPACKKRGKTTPKEMEILGLEEPINIYRPQGCQFCNHTGYKGRIGIHEIMYMNDAMKNEVSRTKNLEQLKIYARDNGMITLWNSCRKLVLSGDTSIQELMTLNIE